MFLIHWPVNGQNKSKTGFVENPMYEIWAGMEKWVEKGLTKSIGISNFNVQLIWDMLIYWNIKPAYNQVEIHPYHQSPELSKFWIENEIAVVAYSPLSAPSRPWGGDTQNVLDDPILNKIAENHNCTSAQVALAWNLSWGKIYFHII